MAVIVPFLVIGMMGMLDLGRAFYYQISITNAVREGARYAVQPYYLGLNPSCATIPPAPNPGSNCVSPGDDAITTHVQNELAGSNIAIPASDIHVTPDQGTRHMKPVFRQQLWQIVARDAAGHVGIAPLIDAH